MDDEIADDEMTLRQMADLESSDDPEDKLRAARLAKAWRGAITEPGFTVPKSDWQEGWSRSMVRDEEAANRVAASFQKVVAQREAHKYDAEDASIQTAKLLSALVELSAAQQDQLTAQADMLGAMVKQTAELTALTEAAGKQDDRRWSRTWPAQIAEVLLSLVAAVFAVLAWRATINQKVPVVNVPAPVVNVPAPVVNIQAPTSSPAPATAPEGPSTSAPR